MPIVNGINYNEKMITDEELAVVEAMRKGAEVNVNFHNSSYETAVKNADELGGMFSDITWKDARHSVLDFIYLSMNSEKLSFTHFIDVDKKSHSAGKQ